MATYTTTYILKASGYIPLSPILVPSIFPVRDITSPVASSRPLFSMSLVSAWRTKLELALYSYWSERAAASAILPYSTLTQAKQLVTFSMLSGTYPDQISGLTQQSLFPSFPFSAGLLAQNVLFCLHLSASRDELLKDGGGNSKMFLILFLVLVFTVS